MTTEILTFGEPLFEFSQIKEALAGQPDYLSGFGGDVSNFAVAAARQGANVGIVTHLGNDSFGKAFLSLWEQEGVKTENVKLSGTAPTGVYFITHSEAGHEFSFLRKGSAASLYQPADLPLKAIEDAKLFHTTAITHAISSSASDAAFAAIEHAKAHNTLTSFDTNLRLKLWPVNRARAIINETIAMVDICFPSLDEAQLLTGLKEANDIADFYLKLGAKVVALKMGGDGAMVATSDERLTIKPHKVEVVDATAAGDSFAGSFCTNYVAGESLQTCLERANATASITITGYGAVAPMPTLDQVKARVLQK